MNDLMLIRFLNKELDEAGHEKVAAWLDESEENKAYLKRLSKLNEATDLRYFDKVDTEKAWSKVRLLTVDKQNSFNWTVWMRYAAAIIILAIAAIFTYQQFTTQDYTELTAREEPYTLEDGTRIWLNTDSKLTYHTDFNNARNVELTGEAFFEVAHDPEHPFTVELGDTKITVLGTSFNLSGTSGNDSVEVVLVTGKISFQVNGQLLELSPGERATWLAGELEKTENENLNFQSWKTGVLAFDNAPLQKVFQDLNKHYHTQLELHDPIAGACTFTGTFDNESLEEVIETFKLIFDAEIQRDTEKIVLKMQPCNQ